MKLQIICYAHKVMNNLSLRFTSDTLNTLYIRLDLKLKEDPKRFKM